MKLLGAKRSLLIFAVIGCLQVVVFGQERTGRTRVAGFLIAGGGALDNLGYSNPILTIGGGAELDSNQMLTTAELSFSLSHKLETGDGHSRKLELASFKRLHNFLLGAGGSYSRTATSQWEKGCWRPFLAVGYGRDGYLIETRYLAPSSDTQNRLGGALVVVNYRGSGHWGTEMRGGIYRFQDTRVSGVYYAQPAAKHTGAETDISLKYYF
jgi:hypothetical protein